MSEEIVKVCKKHGKLKIDQVKREGKYFRCHECKKIKANRRYSNKKNIILEKSRIAYRLKKEQSPLTFYQNLKNEKQKGNCIKHGSNTRNKNGVCRTCSNVASSRWKEKNPERVQEIREKQRIKRNNYEYKQKRIKRLEIRKNEDIQGYRDIMAKKSKEYRKNLPDAYIKQTIRRQRMFTKEGIKIPVDIIPQDLIEIKRLHIKLKKSIKKGNKNGYSKHK